MYSICMYLSLLPIQAHESLVPEFSPKGRIHTNLVDHKVGYWDCVVIISIVGQMNAGELRDKVAKLGRAGLLAYGLFNGIIYTSFFVVAFLGFEKSTGQNPATNLKACLGVSTLSHLIVYYCTSCLVVWFSYKLLQFREFENYIFISCYTINVNSTSKKHLQSPQSQCLCYDFVFALQGYYILTKISPLIWSTLVGDGVDVDWKQFHKAITSSRRCSSCSFHG